MTEPTTPGDRPEQLTLEEKAGCAAVTQSDSNAQS